MTCPSILSCASLRVLLRSSETGQEWNLLFGLKMMEQLLVLGLFQHLRPYIEPREAQ